VRWDLLEHVQFHWTWRGSARNYSTYITGSVYKVLSDEAKLSKIRGHRSCALSPKLDDFAAISFLIRRVGQRNFMHEQISLPQDFWEQLPLRSDEELYEMLANQADYLPEAVSAAESELAKRNLPLERVAPPEPPPAFPLGAGQEFRRGVHASC